VDHRRLIKLWADEDLIAYVRGQAQRWFGPTADAEIAATDAWEMIECMPSGTSMAGIRHAAYCAIRARYMREWRGRKKLRATKGLSGS
jgi:hypothetical protein